VGKLTIIPTPLGNMDDITLRALKALREVDAIACEDTRQTRKIFARHDLSAPEKWLSYHEHNEASAGKKILSLLSDGYRVGLCSDAGFPCMSDPGYKLVVAALDEGHEIETLPGAYAGVTALVASGIPTSSYTFKGFPPRKDGQRATFLHMESELPHTLIFYESPHRVSKFLKVALEVLGNRNCAVCIELTKKFERIIRGNIEHVLGELGEKKLRGEVTIVIEGATRRYKQENSGKGSEL
jgi:16S rRNA (cytidine1402-2'-O)-methyltransferase